MSYLYKLVLKVCVLHDSLVHIFLPMVVLQSLKFSVMRFHTFHFCAWQVRDIMAMPGEQYALLYVCTFLDYINVRGQHMQTI